MSEVEGLFAADLAFLQDLYGIINFGDQADVEALQASVLPEDTDAGDDPGISGTGAADADAADPVGDDAPSASTSRRRGRVEEVTSVSTS